MATKTFLTFSIGEEIFGASVMEVQSILGMHKITCIPQSPHYMKGVINLRGLVLPVIDTRLKLGLPEIQQSPASSIIVVEIPFGDTQVDIGIIVDSVKEVLEVDENNLQDPPTIGAKYKTDYISALTNHNNTFIMLLNLNKLFSSDELSLYEQTTETEIEA